MLLKVTVYHVENMEQHTQMKNVLSSDKSRGDNNVLGSNLVKSDLWNRIRKTIFSHTIFGKLLKKMEKEEVRAAFLLQINNDSYPELRE